jgi:hypothetical protein
MLRLASWAEISTLIALIVPAAATSSLITAVASPGSRKSRTGIDEEGVGVLDGEAVGGVDAVEEQAARPNAPAAASTARRPSITTGYSAGGRLFAWTSTDRLAW